MGEEEHSVNGTFHSIEYRCGRERGRKEGGRDEGNGAKKINIHVHVHIR